MRLPLAAACGALILASCPAETRGPAGPGPGPAVLDPGLTIKGMAACMLDGGDETARVSIYVLWLADSRIGSGFRIMAVYEGSEWIFIPRGRTLSFEFGGRRMELEGEGSMDGRKVLESDEAREIAYYPVALRDLRAIAEAGEVVVNLHGQRRRIRPGSLAELRKSVEAWSAGGGR